jgi:hypothetical protein
MSVSARTGKLVDLVYKARFKGEAVLSVDDLVPEEAEVWETVRSTQKHTLMKFVDNVIDSTRTRWKKGKHPFSVRKKQIDMEQGKVRDYFSAVIIARALQWHEGDKRCTTVFDGRGLNNVTLECIDRKIIKAMGKSFDTWQIRVKIEQIGKVDEDDELIADNIYLYLTADSAREIILIQADTPFGEIKVKLNEFQSAGEGE